MNCWACERTCRVIGSVETDDGRVFCPDCAEDEGFAYKLRHPLIDRLSGKDRKGWEAVAEKCGTTAQVIRGFAGGDTVSPEMMARIEAALMPDDLRHDLEAMKRYLADNPGPPVGFKAVFTG
jgi:hypothetical protein